MQNLFVIKSKKQKSISDNLSDIFSFLYTEYILSLGKVHLYEALLMILIVIIMASSIEITLLVLPKKIFDYRN